MLLPWHDDDSIDGFGRRMSSLSQELGVDGSSRVLFTCHASAGGNKVCEDEDVVCGMLLRLLER